MMIDHLEVRFNGSVNLLEKEFWSCHRLSLAVNSMQKWRNDVITTKVLLVRGMWLVL